jgi:putative phosphonate metabolism protein
MPGRADSPDDEGAGMKEFRRYAVYFAPPAGSALAEAGAALLGWDVELGVAVAQPEIDALPRPIAELTEEPRKYGFHATMKAPFRLREGTELEALVEALEALCAEHEAFALPPLRITRDWSFLALVPSVPCEPLQTLAADCVRDLDGFRAPLTEAEREKRLRNGLDEARRRYLDEWGYPHVFDCFRFHMTLSGRLADDEIDPVAEAFGHYLAPILKQPQEVRELCLFGEAETGRFHLIRRFPLKG